MYQKYKESGLTTTRSYFIISIFSLLIVIVFSYPLTYLFIIINIKYKLVSILWLISVIFVSLIFSYISNFGVLISHCRNKKIAISLTSLGATFGYYIFVCLLITVSSEYSSYKTISINIDVFKTVFRFFDIFVPIIFNSEIGLILAAKVIIGYLILIATIILSYIYLIKNYYSEKNKKWLKK